MNSAAAPLAKNKKITILAGPTGAGKTNLALELAQHHGNVELVYADSIAIYKKFTIGSAKPTLAEQKQTPHHLIDVCEPDYDFTAADFQRLADKAIDDIHSRGKQAIVVGGTGFYIRTLLRGMIEQERIGRNEELRKKLQERLQSEGSQKLYREMIVKDPPLIEKIHPNDEYRIVRALEAMAETGRRWSELNQEALAKPDRYENNFYCIDISREDLKVRIEARTEAMLASGLLDEVKSLLQEGYSPTIKPFQSVGYKQCIDYLASPTSMEQLKQAIVQGTMRLAKNQRTWFRAERGVQLLGITQLKAVLGLSDDK